MGYFILRSKLEHIRTKAVDRHYYRLGGSIVAKYRENATERFGKDFFSQANNYGAPFPVQVVNRIYYN